LYFLSLYFSGDYGIMLWVMIGEIRESSDTQWPMATGIPQGSPISLILFLLYLCPLLDSLQLNHPSIWSPSYIDDIALVAQGKTREGNSRVLEVVARTTFE
jgi:hypothetical protein